MMIYLDNNSTTKVAPEVLEAMLPYLMEEYGNPSSRHYTLARNAENAVEQAREQAAGLLHAPPSSIIFTSGASESNNFIIKGVADYQKYYGSGGRHIVTSAVEHKSVIQTCRFLNGDVFDSRPANRSAGRLRAQSASLEKVDRGYEVTFLPVNRFAQVETEAFEASLREDTILASIMWGNNEIGSINDIAQLSAMADKRGVPFHTDATQVIGKMDLNLSALPVQFLSFSAHKINGPKGIGAAYVRQGFLPYKLTSLIHGGQQEMGYRAGTLAVHNIVGMGKACELCAKDIQAKVERLQRGEVLLKSILRKHFEHAVFLNETCSHIPGMVSAILPDILNELFIKKVSDRAAVSAGSACGIGEPSYVVSQISQSDNINHFLRFSIGEASEEDLLEFDKILEELF